MILQIASLPRWQPFSSMVLCTYTWVPEGGAAVVGALRTPLSKVEDWEEGGEEKEGEVGGEEEGEEEEGKGEEEGRRKRGRGRRRVQQICSRLPSLCPC